MYLRYLISLVVAGIVYNTNFCFAYSYSTLEINGKNINIEICETKEERALGLSGRRMLSPNYGMLFPFETATEHIFWMKEMLIPIDIVWLKGGIIQHIEHSVPPPSPVATKLSTYGHGIVSDQVLEFKAGFSLKNNLKLGDEIMISY